MANPPTYRDLLDFHEKLTKEDPRFAGMSLTELSTQMNTAEGTNEYDAGLRDGFLPRMSVKVDKALENSGVSKFSGDVFKHVANEYVSPMVGRDTAAGFEQMGKDIPRMLGEGAVAAYGLTAGLPATIGLTVPALISSFTKTKVDTGSNWAGAAAAAGNVLPLGVGNLATKVAAKQLAKLPVGTLAKSTEQLIEYGAMSAGLLGSQELLRGTASVATGQGWGDPFSAENVVGNLLSTVPEAGFMLANLGKKGVLSKTTETRITDLAKKLATEESKQRGQDRTEAQPVEATSMLDDRAQKLDGAGIAQKMAEMAAELGVETPEGVKAAMPVRPDFTDPKTPIGKVNMPWVTDQPIGATYGKSQPPSWMENQVKVAEQVVTKVDAGVPTPIAVLEAPVAKKNGKKTAEEKLAELPEDQQKVFGDALTEVMKIAHPDVDLGELAKQGVKFLEKKGIAGPIDPANSALLGQEMVKVLGKNLSLQKKRAATKVENQTLDDAFPPASVENLTEIGQKVLAPDEPVTSDDVDFVEPAPKQGVDPSVLLNTLGKDELRTVRDANVPKVSRIIEGIAYLRDIIVSRDKNGNDTFTYTDASALAAELGMKPKQMRDFVQDQFPKVKEALMKRMTPKASLGLFGFPRRGQAEATQGAAMTHEFFKQWFTQSGYDAAMVERVSGIAVKIASAFQDVPLAAIGDLSSGAVRDTSLGLAGMFGFGKDQKFGLGLNKYLIEKKGGILELRGQPKVDSAILTWESLSTLGHEMLHTAYNTGTRDASLSTQGAYRATVYQNMLATVERMTPQARYDMLRELAKIALPRDLVDTVQYGNVDAQTRNMVYATLGVDPSVVTSSIDLTAADIHGLYGSTSGHETIAKIAELSLAGFVTEGKLFQGATRGEGLKALSDYIKFGDDHMQDFLRSYYVDVLRSVDAVSDFLAIEGRSSGEFKSVAKSMKQLLNDVKDIEQIRADMVAWQNNTSGYAAALQSKFLKDPAMAFGVGNTTFPSLFADIKGMMGLGEPDAVSKQLGVEPGFFTRVFVPAQQLAEKHPMLAPVIDLVFGFRAIANKSASNAMSYFMHETKLGKLEFTSESPIVKVLSDPEMSRAFSAIGLLQNETKKALTGAEMMDVVESFPLSKAEQQHVIDSVLATQKAMPKMMDTIIRGQRESMGTTVAAGLMLKTKVLKAVDAKKIGDDAVRWIIDNDLDAKNRVAGFLKAHSAAEPLSVTAVLNDIYTDVAAQLPVLQDRMARIQDRPYYMPEVRLGEFMLRWKEDGKVKFVGFKTRAEANARFTSLQKKAGVEADSIKVYDKSDKTSQVNVLQTEMVRNFSQIERDAFEKRIATQDPETQKLLRDLYTPGEAVFNEVNSRGYGKYFKERKLVGGREELNFAEGVLDYIAGVSTGLAKRQTKELSAVYMMDPELRANPKMQKLLSEHVKNVVEPPTKEWTKLKNGVFLYTMGMNVSSMMVEKVQPLFTLVPFLVENGQGVGQAYKSIVGAMTRLREQNGAKPDPMLASALKRASEDQVLDFGVFQELANAEDMGVANLRNLTTGQGSLGSIVDLVSKPVVMYSNFAKSMYTKASSHNNAIAFVAGFDHGIKQGMTFEQAYSMGVRTTRTSNYGGGQAARPVGMFANSGKFFGAVGAWYTLQNYTLSSISFMGRLLGKSIDQHGGLSVAQKTNAKKALGTMLATQTMLAGTLGLPFVAASMAVIDQLFPEAELKRRFKELPQMLAEYAGADEETGRLVSDVISDGGLTAIPGLNKLDLSGRFGLGTVLGVSPNNGITQNTFGGAPVSVLMQVMKGAGQVVRGNVAEGMQTASPTAFKNLIDGVRNDHVIRDAQGRMVYEPDMAETLLGTLGFRQKRLSNFREQQAMLKVSEDNAAKEQRSFHGRVADMLLAGNVQGARAELLKRQGENPQYDAAAGAQAVSTLATEKANVTREPREGLSSNAGQRARISGLFPTAQQPISEVNRIMEEMKYKQALAIGSTGLGLSHQRLQSAVQLDELLQAAGMNRQLAQQALRRSRQGLNP